MFKSSKMDIRLLYIVLLMISICYMLIQPDIIVNSIKSTLSTFILTVLPTLFPFILCSQMIIMLNGAKIIGYPLRIITKLLKINNNVAGAYATSLIGGYPSGAASLSLLYQKKAISKNFLVSMLLCSSCGPMFVIGTVGTLMLGSYGAGIVILCSHILGGIINAFLFVLFQKKEGYRYTTKKVSAPPNKAIDIFDSLDRSILNTSKIMLKIFAFMGMFKLVGDAVFINSSQTMQSVSLLEVVFRGTMEILDGCISAARLDFFSASTACCFIVSFGGLSAVLQSISISKDIPYSRWAFVLGKITHGLISSFICFVFIRVLPFSIDTFAIQSNLIINTQFTVPTIMFVLIGICALYLVGRVLYFKRL